jgi:nitroimidazol reductase NimA-like FMN-containing flavoprotein (pyridoxamine 5'-phosphate oxidase superfamily)
MNSGASLSRIKTVLKGQRLGILATLGADYPYQNIVSYSVSSDLKIMIFATSRASMKYANIQRSKRVAIFVDNRKNTEQDLLDAVGITALGDAKELSGAEERRGKRALTARHPYLEEFVSSPGVALFAVRVKVFYAVSRFQDVEELVPR